MKFQNPSFKIFWNKRTLSGRTSRKQYAPHFFKVGGIIKLSICILYIAMATAVSIDYTLPLKQGTSFQMITWT